MQTAIKIKITKADETLQKNYLTFCRDFHGYRFKKNGYVRDKFEMFGAIVRKEVSVKQLFDGTSDWQVVETDYSAKK